jgi:hypothetical protein
MTYWRRLVSFIGVVAFVTAAACGQSLAHAAPTIYACAAAAQHSSTTTEHHGVNGTAIRASLLGEDAGADDPTRPARHFVAADTVPDYVNVASPGRTEHILNGDATGGGHMWPGAPGKTPFPEDWSGAKIMHEASDVATDPNSTVLSRGGGRTVLTGTRDGVDIRVVVDYNNNDIITAYPTNLPRN